MTPSPEIVNTTSMWHYSACRHVGEVSKMEENMFHTKQLHHSHLPFRAGKYRKKVFYEERVFPKRIVWLESVGKELPDFSDVKVTYLGNIFYQKNSASSY